MKPLRLLLLEDDPCDIELLRRTLVAEWPESELLCVNCKSEFRRALKEVEQSVLRQEAEEELRRSEEQYRDLFENATDLIQIISPEGQFLYMNRAWLQALEYDREAAQKLVLLEIVHPEYRETCR